VSASRSEVTLDPKKAATETIEISNGMDGAIQLSLVVDGKVKGLSTGIDKTDVPAGAKGIVRGKYVPEAGNEGAHCRLLVTVEQTRQVFPVEIRFQKPEVAAKK